ncbi:MAG: NAD(+)/NADH kinase [Thermodesulfobacteriota bacterium]
MKNIGIIAKLNKSEALEVTGELIGWLEGHKVEVFLDSDLATEVGRNDGYSKNEIPSMVEMLIVLGGDGTLLSAARVVGTREVPILGVNLGGLGFLTEITLDELYQVLESVLNGEFETEERMMLSIRVVRWGEEIANYTALNDVVINKGTLARIIDLETKIDGEYVNTYRADGLVIATPTGSTAYSRSAGGPIIYPSIHSIIISPICPFNTTNHPIVVPNEAVIDVTMKTGESDLLLTLDGQVGFPLKVGDVIKVKKATSYIYLITSPARSYYEVLRTKLKWGI